MSFPISMLSMMLGVLLLVLGLGQESFLGKLVYDLIGGVALYFGCIGATISSEDEEDVKGGAR